MNDVCHEQPIKKTKRTKRMKREARKNGLLMTQGDKLAMRRTIRLSKENADLVSIFDKTKCEEWNRFVEAFERLWMGAAYLPSSESQALNNIQREVAAAKRIFKSLEREHQVI